MLLDSLSRLSLGGRLSHGIVTNDLGISYSGAGLAEELRDGPLSQTDMFSKTGFYCKALPRIGEAAYALVLNTILGGSNAVQQNAFHESLAWILAKHGDAGIVYVLGHQPGVASEGADVVAGPVPATRQGRLRGAQPQQQEH